MNIAIIGTGSLACIYAARLSTVADVTMYGNWTTGVEAIRRTGVHLVEPDGRIWQVIVPVFTSAEVEADVEGLPPPAEVALILVKSFQTPRAAELACGVLAPDGLAVTLQNGLDNYEAIVDEVGEDRVAVGVTYNAATQLAPAEVRHVAHNPTYLGQTERNAVRIAALARLLERAGIETEVGEDIEARLWGKAVVNAAINPLTALWRIPNGDLVRMSDRRWLLRRLVEEAANVARARGVVLPFEDPVAFAEAVCRNTAENHSSMLQDIERGRPTEIDSINGIIITEGKRLGVHVGVNEIICRLMRAV